MYICVDIFEIISWKSYDFKSQSISDLTAVGSPIRQSIVILYFINYLVMIIFALGVVFFDPKNLYLQVVGYLLLGNVIFSIGGLFFPKYLNEAINSSNNVKNTIVMATSVILFLVAMVIGALAFNNWFRFVTIGIPILFIALAFIGVYIIPTITDTVVSGLQERTMAYFYVLWIFLLSINLLFTNK